MTRPRIALVTGGYSSEAVISYKSAVTIDAHLDRERYDVYRIDITPEGWFHSDAEGRRTEVDRSVFSIRTADGHVRFDAAFIGIHGTPGEDGRLQGYFDMIGLPYTSCDAATSSITFTSSFVISTSLLSSSSSLSSLPFPFLPLLILHLYIRL